MYILKVALLTFVLALTIELALLYVVAGALSLNGPGFGGQPPTYIWTSPTLYILPVSFTAFACAVVIIRKRKRDHL